MDDHHRPASTMSHLVQTTLSYNTNVMLAAVISLLLVILFVLLLHLYAKWFLAHSRRHRTRHSLNVTLPARHLLPPTSHHRRFTFIDATADDNSHDHHQIIKGLHPSAIASIPLFIFTISKHPQLPECAICLSAFEEDEVGRKLPECGHAFHVECIDMWLRSHSTCPICRAGIYIQHRKSSSSSSTYKNEEELQQGGGGGTGELIIESPGVNRDHEDNTTDDHDAAPPETVETVTVDDQNLEDQSVINNINDDVESGPCPSSSASSLGGSLMRLLSSSSRSGGRIHPSNHNAGDLEG